jgi:hypothetical protein
MRAWPRIATGVRWWLAVIGAAFGALFLVPAGLMAMQGAPDPLDWEKLLKVLPPNLLMIVFGAMGMVWIRKNWLTTPAAAATPAISDEAKKSIDTLSQALTAFSERFGAFLLEEAKQQEPRARAVKQIDSMMTDVRELKTAVAALPAETSMLVMEDLEKAVRLSDRGKAATG